VRCIASLAFAGLILAFATNANAQTQSPPPPSPSPAPPSDPCGSILSTVNRPTVATSPCSVRTNHVLLESGYTNTTTTGTGVGTTVSYPQSLLRVGTANPHIEYDLTFPTYERSRAGNAVVGGSGDAAIGLQTELGYSSSAVWGANVFVTLPTGSTAFTAGSSQYVANFNVSDTLSPAMSLFSTVGFDELSALNSAGNAQSYFTFVPSVGAALTLSPVSQAFAEAAYYTQAGLGLGSRVLFDFGYQHTFGSHVVLDINGGFSPPISNGSRQHYVGAGISLMN
jgi:hypothetical protein